MFWLSRKKLPGSYSRLTGQIVEENLMYDLVTFMKQLGRGG